MPRNMPCLTCVTLMLYSCNNPSRVLHECSINDATFVCFPPDFHILILLTHVAVIIKESTAWLSSSSLWHRMQKLSLLQQIRWYVYALLSPSLFSPFSLYIYCSPLKVVEHYVVLFLFFVTFGIWWRVGCRNTAHLRSLGLYPPSLGQ